MGKFWKEVVGGQVNTGVYQAGPRHAQKQYGSFKTGRPPRLPFQFVTYFEINPNVTWDYIYSNSSLNWNWNSILSNSITPWRYFEKSNTILTTFFLN